MCKIGITSKCPNNLSPKKPPSWIPTPRRAWDEFCFMSLEDENDWVPNREIQHGGRDCFLILNTKDESIPWNRMKDHDQQQRSTVHIILWVSPDCRAKNCSPGKNYHCRSFFVHESVLYPCIITGCPDNLCRNLKDLYENILRFIFKPKYWVECSCIDQNKRVLTSSVVFCCPCGWEWRISVFWRFCVRHLPEGNKRETREESIWEPHQRRADFHPKNRIAPLPNRAPSKAEMLRHRFVPFVRKSIQNSKR